MRRIARSAVFLDRDGVIIENRHDYVKSWAEVSFIPGALEALHHLSSCNHVLVLVTNQSAVGRGIISLEQAMDINHQVIAEIKAQGGRVDACYVCPHRPDQRCDCRKPAPGMLLRAAEQLNVDLTRSYLVGDAVTDMQAAWAAGAQGIMVLTGRGHEQLALLRSHNGARCQVVPDLEGALQHILT
jgi:D-glycero-D-manno-heptose 1,7-bisphosphate phosphatase